MLTWDQCFEDGMSANVAAVQMNCSPRTADRALRLAAVRSEARVAATKRFERDVTRLARTECRPKSEKSSYPTDLLEVSDLHLGILRSSDGPLTDRMRNMASQGIPYTEITPNYGNERHPTASLSRAQSDLDAAARYRDAWARIDARETQTEAA